MISSGRDRRRYAGGLLESEELSLFSRSRQAVTFTFVLCAAALLVFSSSAGAQQAERLTVVSLGDSYIAGTGTGNYYSGQGPGFPGPTSGVPGPGNNCYQSFSSYPWQYVGMLNENGVPADIWHYACHGAETTDLIPQWQQIDRSIRDDADIVLISAGGNDVGFSNIVPTCFLSPSELSGATCDQHLTSAEENISNVIGRLRQILPTIASEAPSARVVLMGYPHLASPAPTIFCNQLETRNAERLTNLQQNHDIALINTARELNEIFGDNRFSTAIAGEAFSNRGPCAHPDDALILNVVLSDPFGESFHPNFDGARRYAQLLLDGRHHERLPASPPIPTTPTAGPTMFSSDTRSTLRASGRAVTLEICGSNMEGQTVNVIFSNNERQSQVGGTAQCLSFTSRQSFGSATFARSRAQLNTAPTEATLDACANATNFEAFCDRVDLPAVDQEPTMFSSDTRSTLRASGRAVTLEICGSNMEGQTVNVIFSNNERQSQVGGTAQCLSFTSRQSFGSATFARSRAQLNTAPTEATLDACANATNFEAFCDRVDLSLESPEASPVLLCNGIPVTVDIGAGDRPTSGDDVILGTEGPDTINALEGRDLICGLGGDDVINAGDGADIVLGGEGNDVINAGQGRDVVYGEADDDFVSGGKGKDTLSGGSGNDDLRGNQGTDSLIGGTGDDLLRGGQKADLLSGGNGADSLVGGTRPDVLDGGSGIDEYDGGGGLDTCLADPANRPETRRNCES